MGLRCQPIVTVITATDNHVAALMSLNYCLLANVLLRCYEFYLTSIFILQICYCQALPLSDVGTQIYLLNAQISISWLI